MLDWEFTDELDDVADASIQDERRLWRSWRFWLLVTLLIGVIGGAGTVGVRWWLDNRQDAMREDIHAVIEQEEQARSFGLQERASEFVAPGISRTWWDAYRNTFRQRRNRAPVDLTLEDVTFDDTGALVSVQLDGYTQLRHYRLVGQQWRRAPLPDELWSSGEREILQIDDDIHLLFRPRDREFAEELARDLPALLATMESWPDGGPRFNQIEILANELQPALISSGVSRIEINSPLLVPYDGRLGGEAAVQFALASTLAWQNTSVSDDLQPLPGGTRMLSAVKTITALHWALTEEEQARFREGWRSRLDDEWTSPFFTEMLLSSSQSTVEQVHAEFAALLTADYVYSIGGAEALADLLAGMTQHNSWDEILQMAVDRNTITLEREAAAYARGVTAQRVSIPDTATALPAAGRLQPKLRNGYLTLAVAGEESLLIDTAAAPRLHTPDGTPLALNCIDAGSTIRADGEWLEAGRRLAARDIVVTEPVPPAPLGNGIAAPTDTIAYLAAGSTAAPVSIFALRADHTRTRLLNVGNARNVHLQSDERGTRLYFFYYPDNCSRSWLIDYEPASGRVAGWLMRPAAPTDSDLWKPEYLRERGTILLTGTVLPDNTHRYRLLDPAAPFDLGPALEMNLHATPIGWSEALDQVVVVGGNAAGDRIGVTALDDRVIHWFDKPIPSLRFTSLSRSGRWFVYSHLDDQQNEVLRLFDLTTGELQTLQTLAPDEDVTAGAWSLSYEDERLVLLIGRRTQRWVSGRMIVIDPRAPLQTTIAAESNGDIWFQNPVLCADGRLFYRQVSADPNENSVWLMLRESAGAEPIRLYDDPQSRVIACG